MARKPCGKHVSLANNDAVKVSQCPCGTVYVQVVHNGVTVRLTEEGFRQLSKGLGQALERVEDGALSAIN